MARRLLLPPMAVDVVLASCFSMPCGDSAPVVSVDIDQDDLTLTVGTSVTLPVTGIVTGGATDTVARSSDDVAHGDGSSACVDAGTPDSTMVKRVIP